MAFFGKKLPKIYHFGLNSQKQMFLHFFPKTAHWNFLIFCTKPSLLSRKKMTVSLFCRKFKNDPFWPKFTQIWPKFGHIWLYETWSMGVQKKNGVKNFENFLFFFLFFFCQNRKKNYFGRKKSTFCPDEHHYDSPLPTLRKILKFLKWRFFAFFSKKIKKKFVFHLFSWNMVSIVKVEIFGFLPFSNWPDFYPKWAKIGHFGPQMAQN